MKRVIITTKDSNFLIESIGLNYHLFDSDGKHLDYWHDPSPLIHKWRRLGANIKLKREDLVEHLNKSYEKNRWFTHDETTKPSLYKQYVH